jgi:hypothetical protein
MAKRKKSCSPRCKSAASLENVLTKLAQLQAHHEARIQDYSDQSRVIGLTTKWAVRRYQPAGYRLVDEGGAQPLMPCGFKEESFDSWRDVCTAADTILGENCLQQELRPSDPVVIQDGEDVVLIYMKLDF